ncbi:hypothetical protein Hanom_Chr04g00318591 [Helianthus anomalus]
MRCGFKNFSFHTPSLPPNSPRPIFLFLKTPKIPLKQIQPHQLTSSARILSEPWFQSTQYLHHNHNHYQYQLPQSPNQFWLPSNPHDCFVSKMRHKEKFMILSSTCNVLVKSLMGIW